MTHITISEIIRNTRHINSCRNLQFELFILGHRILDNKICAGDIPNHESEIKSYLNAISQGAINAY